MVGVIIWALAVIAIFLLLKGYYDYKYFIACYDGLIFSRKRVWQFLVGRWEWFKDLRFLKQAYIVVAGFTAVALFILFFRLYLEVLLFDWGKTENVDSSIRNLALAFLGTTSGIGALFGVYLAILRSEENTRQNKIANDQNEITEQGLITDRINKAVESLGKINQKGEPVLEVRIGALYALERIAQDSIEDHIRIMKIICAYIYVRQPLKNSRETVNAVKEDIRAALIIIGRRGKWTEDQEHLKEEIKQKYRLDLRCCNLRNADLVDTNFSNAWISESVLGITVLHHAKLNGAIINRTNFTDTRLNKADFKNTNVIGSFAYKGDFSTCLNLTQEQLNGMYCGKDVKIPKMDGNKKLTRPRHWREDSLSYDDFIKAYEEWLKETGN